MTLLDAKIRKWAEATDPKVDLSFEFSTEIMDGKSIKARVTAHWRDDTGTASSSTPGNQGNSLPAVNPNAWMDD
jgi:hypothetical protein